MHNRSGEARRCPPMNTPERNPTAPPPNAQASPFSLFAKELSPITPARGRYQPGMLAITPCQSPFQPSFGIPQFNFAAAAASFASRGGAGVNPMQPALQPPVSREMDEDMEHHVSSQSDGSTPKRARSGFAAGKLRDLPVQSLPFSPLQSPPLFQASSGRLPSSLMGQTPAILEALDFSLPAEQQADANSSWDVGKESSMQLSAGSHRVAKMEVDRPPTGQVTVNGMDCTTGFLQAVRRRSQSAETSSQEQGMSRPPRERRRCLDLVFGSIPEHEPAAPPHPGGSLQPGPVKLEQTVCLDQYSQQAVQAPLSSQQPHSQDLLLHRSDPEHSASSLHSREPQFDARAFCSSAVQAAKLGDTSSPALTAVFNSAAYGNATSGQQGSWRSAAAVAVAAATPISRRQSVSGTSGAGVLAPETPGEPLLDAGRRQSIAGSCKRCNCKKSKCLKLYCDCFAAGQYCTGCSCINCANQPDNEAVVQAARDAIRQRNPQAFDQKIGKGSEETGREQHKRGCNCKKSHCRKKYCECFQAGVPCGDSCKCENCHNCRPGDDGINKPDTTQPQAVPQKHPAFGAQQIRPLQSLSLPGDHIAVPDTPSARLSGFGC